MHVVFLILKILGIALLVLLGLILAVLLVVLFVPFRYQLTAHRQEDGTWAKASIGWLAGLVKFYVSYTLGSGLAGELRIFLFSIKRFGKNTQERAGDTAGKRKGAVKEKRPASPKAEEPSAPKKESAPAGTAQEAERTQSAHARAASEGKKTESAPAAAGREAKKPAPAQTASEKKAGTQPAAKTTGQEQAGTQPAAKTTGQEQAGTQPAAKTTGQEQAGTQPAVKTDGREKTGSQPSSGKRMEELLGEAVCFAAGIPEKAADMTILLLDLFDILEEKIGVPAEKVRSLSQKAAPFTDASSMRAYRHICRRLWIFLCHCRVRRADGYIHFGTGKPDLTGKLTGLLYMLQPALAGNVRIEPEMLETLIEGDLSIKGHLRLCHGAVLAAALLADKDTRRLIGKIRRARGDRIC